MKYKILVCLFIISCHNPREKKEFTMVINTGDYWNATYRRVECDSFQMLNTKEAFIWKNGTKMKVVSEGSLGVYSN